MHRRHLLATAATLACLAVLSPFVVERTAWLRSQPAARPIPVETAAAPATASPGAAPLTAKPVGGDARAPVTSAIAPDHPTDAAAVAKAVAELEERAAELSSTTTRKGNRRVETVVTGKVPATLTGKPGTGDEGYVVSNNSGRGRFRFVGDTKVDNGGEGYRVQLDPGVASGDTAKADGGVAASPPKPTETAKGEFRDVWMGGYRLRRNTDGKSKGDSFPAQSEQIAAAPAVAAPAKPTEPAAKLLSAPPLEGRRADHNARIATLDQPADARAEAVEQGRDRYASTDPYPVKPVASEPVSTFSIDVDTASYAIVRRHLARGAMPPPAAVRAEELINYFAYDYARPQSLDAPFAPQITVMPSPWTPGRKLVHIGLKGYELTSAERPRANLVLLIDVSGSMAPADRLPLLRSAFRMLVDELRPEDTVSIVTYANGTRVALEPTPVRNTSRIMAALGNLTASGGTNGEGGLQLAYAQAEQSFDAKAVNRIILATDGDFNIGISDREALKRYIEGKRQSGIYLSVLGVGMGNHNDALMQALAQNGNGTAAYIDTLAEARKVLVEEASSTLFTIARDVKIQIEFNPARVADYRLVGYETRALKRQDFNNDKVDAGDVGSGHTVTAIYEITPAGPAMAQDGLRYPPVTLETQRAAAPAAPQNGEYAFFKLRYKRPGEDHSRLITLPVTEAMERPTLAATGDDVRFSVAVAAFAQKLKGVGPLADLSYDDIAALAQGAKGEDPFGLRAELVTLVRMAKVLHR